MNLLTEKAFELSRTGIFTYSDVLVWLGEGRNSVRGLVKRAIAAGEIIHILRQDARAFVPSVRERA